MDSAALALKAIFDYTSVLMADLRSFLDEREKALEAEIASFRKRIVPLERELFEIRIAKRAVGRSSTEPLQQRLFGVSERDGHVEEAEKVWHDYRESEAERARSPYERMTIKELVLKALEEQFPSGATAKQMLDLFRNAWGRREMVRTSLSPQLSRLKAEHKIDRHGSLWFARHPRPEPPETNAATDQ